MKTTGFGCLFIVVALLLFAASCHPLAFVCMLVGCALVTFDRRWLKERHEIEDEDDD